MELDCGDHEHSECLLWSCVVVCWWVLEWARLVTVWRWYLELRAASGIPRKTGKAPPRRISSRERNFIRKLIDKHGDDLEVQIDILLRLLLSLQDQGLRIWSMRFDAGDEMGHKVERVSALSWEAQEIHWILSLLEARSRPKSHCSKKEAFKNKVLSRPSGVSSNKNTRLGCR